MKDISFKKYFKHNSKDTSINSNPPSFQLGNAVRDWRIIVLIFAVGLISLTLFSWHIYLSNQIGGGYLTPDVPPTSTTEDTINKKSLETDILFLDTRQSDFNKIKNNPAKLSDPSL